MNLLRATATIGSLTLLSRLLGFVRDMMIATFLGVGMLSDAFQVAFKLPNFMRQLFAEGAFNAAFVPLYAGTRASEGDETARKLAQEVHAGLLLVLVIVSTLGIIFMPQLLVALAPGFNADPQKTGADRAAHPHYVPLYPVHFAGVAAGRNPQQP